MGTTYSIKWAGVSGVEREKVQNRVDEDLKAFDLELSNWNRESWVTQFNAGPEHRSSAMPAHVREVLVLCSELHRQTGGAFDVTVSPLLELWGFGVNSKKEVPDDEAITQALSLVGFEKIKLDLKMGTLEKLAAGVAINCSALAKGYGVDLIGEILEREFGLHHYMVEIGGEVRARGNHPEHAGWNLGISRPESDATSSEFLGAIQLQDLSMATSGDYQNFFVYEGNVMPHIFDPKTGLPVRHGLASVSIVSSTCALADGLATACMVLGVEKSRRLLEKYPGTSGYFVERTAKGEYRKTSTAGFPEWLAP